MAAQQGPVEISEAVRGRIGDLGVRAKMQNRLAMFSWILLLLLCVYVIAYFALVRVGSGVEDRGLGRVELHPDYHGLSSELFIPIHEVDRMVLRPRRWSFKGTTEEYERYMGFRP